MFRLLGAMSSKPCVSTQQARAIATSTGRSAGSKTSRGCEAHPLYDTVLGAGDDSVINLLRRRRPRSLVLENVVNFIKEDPLSGQIPANVFLSRLKDLVVNSDSTPVHTGIHVFHMDARNWLNVSRPRTVASPSDFPNALSMPWYAHKTECLLEEAASTSTLGIELLAAHALSSCSWSFAYAPMFYACLASWLRRATPACLSTARALHRLTGFTWLHSRMSWAVLLPSRRWLRSWRSTQPTIRQPPIPSAQQGVP